MNLIVENYRYSVSAADRVAAMDGYHCCKCIGGG